MRNRHPTRPKTRLTFTSLGGVHRRRNQASAKSARRSPRSPRPATVRGCGLHHSCPPRRARIAVSLTLPPVAQARRSYNTTKPSAPQKWAYEASGAGRENWDLCSSEVGSCGGCTMCMRAKMMFDNRSPASCRKCTTSMTSQTTK